MRRVRAALIALALALPHAHAQGGIETIFDETLKALCDSQGALTTVPIGGLGVEIPGVTDFGLDLRPLCQYANIAERGARTLKDLRNGTFTATEQFINDTLTALANTIGTRVGTQKANDLIDELDAKLTAALESDDEFLSLYREATQDVVQQLREEALAQAEENFQNAVTAVEGAAPGAPIAPRTRVDASVPYAAMVPDIVDAQAASLAQELEAQALTQGSTQLLEEQLENNAYQQTIEDTLRIATLPGEEGGVAQSLVRDAQRATSVRQSINVLTESIAAQLRNDAVFTGALIENLQANARQQAITNHQLGILATQVLAEQERELADAEAEFMADYNQAVTEIEESFNKLHQAIENLDYVTDPTPMRDIGFSFCGMFGGC